MKNIIKKVLASALLLLVSSQAALAQDLCPLGQSNINGSCQPNVAAYKNDKNACTSTGGTWTGNNSTKKCPCSCSCYEGYYVSNNSQGQTTGCIAMDWN